MTCLLEQSLIMKPGVVCIVGAVDNGLRWGNACSDSILKQLHADDRVALIICAVLDRRPDDFLSFSKCHLLLVNPSLEMSLCDKISQSLQETMINDYALSTAFMLHSFSEIIIQEGLVAALKWLQWIFTLGFRTIVLLIHEQLHSTSEVSLIQSYCSIILKTKPVMASSFLGNPVVDIQIIQKSGSSTKVTEGENRYTLESNGNLILIASNSVSNNGSYTTTGSAHISVTASTQESIIESIGKLEVKIGGTAKSGASKNNAAVALPLDDFFEDAEDPDGDLDL